MSHKAGFVNIIGNPNVGKSTLMNALVKEKLSIITSKSQTTRHRIMGIVNGEDFQIVYSDTPGIIQPKYALQESMMGFVKNALIDADILLYVSDVVETIDKNADYLDQIRKLDIPVILVLNKIDLSTQDEVEKKMKVWQEMLPDAFIIPISATEKFNLEQLFETIIEKLPESPAYFPEDELTDKSERFFTGEIIREKILLNYQKEIPYSVEIEVESFKNEENLLRIRTIIYVVRDSQKGILIGHQGQMLKKTGTMARKDLEEFFGKKVFLELYVKVAKDWRNNERHLRSFGYR